MPTSPLPAAARRQISSTPAELSATSAANRCTYDAGLERRARIHTFLPLAGPSGPCRLHLATRLWNRGCSLVAHRHDIGTSAFPPLLGGQADMAIWLMSKRTRHAPAGCMPS